MHATSHCVSSPDETLRRELKIRRAAEEFLADFQEFHLCQMPDITSQKKKILEREIKDAKPSSFSSDYQTLIKHFKISFVFLMNY